MKLEPPKKKIKIAVSAGELSGDEHASRILHALQDLLQIKTEAIELELRGMGGRHLREAGVTTVVDSEKAASVMGFGPVLKSLHKIIKAFSTMKKLLSEWRPDVLLLVDFPDFNLRLAKQAKKLGIPVLYFNPPQVWAWRSKRIELIRRYIDIAALMFPFERDFYLKHKMTNAVFVGHPFATELKRTIPQEESKKLFCQKWGLDFEQPLLAIFPGSRKQEILHHLSPIEDAWKILKDTGKKITGVICVASSLDCDLLKKQLKNPDDFYLYQGSSLELLQSADAGIVKSGTSNLQAAFFELPFAMIYIAPKISEWIVRYLVKLKQFSPVNLVRPNSIREFLQTNVSGTSLAKEIEELIWNDSYRQTLKQNLLEVKERLSLYEELPELKQQTITSTPAIRTAHLLLRLATATRQDGVKTDELSQ